MAIQQQIEHDYLAAFKGHDQAKVDALRLIKAALKNYEIEVREGILSDQQIVAVLMKEAKKRKEAIALYQQGNRLELAAIEEAELRVIMTYLPALMDAAAIDAVVSSVVAELKPTPKDFGKVMSAVMAKVKGQADGNMVSAAVKKALV